MMSRHARGLPVVCLSVAMSLAGWSVSLGQPQNPASEIATVEELKSQAFAALKLGHFDQTGTLLRQASEINKDPTLEKMTSWLSEFQVKQAHVTEQRRKEYQKLFDDTKKLEDAGYMVDAADAVARASRYADDRDKFREEAWVKTAIDRTIALAADAERDGLWVRASRLYGDLSAIEPNNSKWRTKINDIASRRAILAIYAPDTYAEVLKAETADSEKARQLLNPELKPTTKPVDETLDDTFKIDWKDIHEGVKVDMLREALEDARENYYRDVSYADMLAGGLKSIDLLVSTQGLEKTFPSLGDETKRKAFEESLKLVRDQVAVPEGGLFGSDRRAVGKVVDALLEANRNSLALPDSVIIYQFANGAMAVLDPFTNVIWPYDLIDFNAQTQGEFTGVGIQIQNNDEGYIKVVTPLEDSPALRAGVQPDDVITHIDGKSGKGLSVDRAKKHITGPAGTIVNLTIRSTDGSSRDVLLRREVIKTASVKGWTHKPGGGWDFLLDPSNGVGYVRISNFTRDTGKELGAALRQIKTQDGRAVIIDLRTNPGGLLTAAAEVVDRFMDHGVIVSTKSARVHSQSSPPLVARAQDDDVKDMPLIVLVNQYSASASEIVSGALKDHERALIVGERTFGKGSVQIVVPISDKTANLKLTTSHYYLPSGRCIHREDDSSEWGVEPNLTVEVTPEQMGEINRIRQQLDILRDAPSTQPTSMPAEFKTPEDYLMASDPQLSTALLLLRMQLAGASLM